MDYRDLREAMVEAHIDKGCCPSRAGEIFDVALELHNTIREVRVRALEAIVRAMTGPLRMHCASMLLAFEMDSVAALHDDLHKGLTND